MMWLAFLPWVSSGAYLIRLMQVVHRQGGQGVIEINEINVIDITLGLQIILGLAPLGWELLLLIEGWGKLRNEKENRRQDEEMQRRWWES